MKYLLLLVLASLTWSCFPDGHNNSSTSTEIILDYSDTTIRSLTIPQAMILKDNYIKNYLPIIKEQLGVDDTQYIHYNLEDLKNLVWYIEYYSKASGKEISPKDLGVNIHFGQYPKEEDLSDFPLKAGEGKILAGKQTLFFVPTIKIDGEIKEFNPKKNAMEISRGESKKIKTLFEHYQNQLGTFKKIDFEEDSPIADFGTLCPPCISPQI